MSWSDGVTVYVTRVIDPLNFYARIGNGMLRSLCTQQNCSDNELKVHCTCSVEIMSTVYYPMAYLEMGRWAWGGTEGPERGAKHRSAEGLFISDVAYIFEIKCSNSSIFYTEYLCNFFHIQGGVAGASPPRPKYAPVCIRCLIFAQML